MYIKLHCRLHTKHFFYGCYNNNQTTNKTLYQEKGPRALECRNPMESANMSCRILINSAH